MTTSRPLPRAGRATVKTLGAEALAHAMAEAGNELAASSSRAPIGHTVGVCWAPCSSNRCAKRGATASTCDRRSIHRVTGRGSFSSKSTSDPWSTVSVRAPRGTTRRLGHQWAIHASAETDPVARFNAIRTAGQARGFVGRCLRWHPVLAGIRVMPARSSRRSSPKKTGATTVNRCPAPAIA